MLLTLLAFFLAVGVAAHAVDAVGSQVGDRTVRKSQTCLNAIFVFAENARPQGLLGTSRVEIV